MFKKTKLKLNFGENIYLPDVGLHTTDETLNTFKYDDLWEMIVRSLIELNYVA